MYNGKLKLVNIQKIIQCFFEGTTPALRLLIPIHKMGQPVITLDYSVH